MKDYLKDDFNYYNLVINFIYFIFNYSKYNFHHTPSNASSTNKVYLITVVRIYGVSKEYLIIFLYVDAVA